MKKSLFLVFIVVLCAACGGSHIVVGEAAVTGQTADTLSAARQIRVMGLGNPLYAPSIQPEYAARPATAILKFVGKGTVAIVEGCPPPICILTVGYIDAQNPDIIVLGGNYFSAMNTEMFGNALNALNYFVKIKRGVLLAFCESEHAATLVNRIFGSAVSGGLGNEAGSAYRFRFIDDPILNGTFGDLRSRHWGEDATITATLSPAPDSAVVFTYGNTIYTSQVTALRHTSLGFVWVGDSGFLFGNGNDSISNPCHYEAGIPAPQIHYGTPVYNSIFYANAIDWAINYVQKNKKHP
ncbi:hypothetical protein FACS189434_04020 [Bacteroidia bacterium]|nr:hypothetical protein FACS189434_04020 [Bacteroidia bacterium]